jgi:hypothetical protein
MPAAAYEAAVCCNAGLGAATAADLTTRRRDSPPLAPNRNDSADRLPTDTPLSATPRAPPNN